MDPQLEALVKKHPDVNLVKIDIVRWDSPVAEQFGIRRLPYVMLYENSRLVSNDVSQVLRVLD